MPKCKARISLALSVLLVIVVGGCSASVSTGGDQLDTGKAEKEITKGIEDQNSGVKVKSVDCPNDVDLKKGTKTDCDVVLENGATGTAHITQTDDKGNITYKVN